MARHIFFSKGQLGNQIFQYLFMNSLPEQGGKCFSFGFNNLDDVFEVPKGTILPYANYISLKMSLKVLEPLLLLLSKLRVIDAIHQKTTTISDETTFTTGFIKKKGIVPFLCYVHRGFFQSESFFSGIDPSKVLTIKAALLDRAKTFLARIEPSRKCFFVHIRRGSYQDWKPLGRDVLLPVDYYHRCIEHIQSRFPEAFFIFLTNDHDYVKEHFGYLDNKTLSQESAGVDFTIMTLCHGGVLSPSTFSWWGAYFASDNDTSGKMFMAPRYWAGFSSRVWYPDGIKTDRFTYVDVEQA